MKQIEIRYSRKVTYSKIVDVDDPTAEKLLALNGADGNIFRNRSLEILTEYCDESDIFDEDDWLEDVEVENYTG